MSKRLIEKRRPAARKTANTAALKGTEYFFIELPVLWTGIIDKISCKAPIGQIFPQNTRPKRKLITIINSRPDIIPATGIPGEDKFLMKRS